MEGGGHGKHSMVGSRQEQLNRLRRVDGKKEKKERKEDRRKE